MSRLSSQKLYILHCFCIKTLTFCFQYSACFISVLYLILNNYRVIFSYFKVDMVNVKINAWALDILSLNPITRVVLIHIFHILSFQGNIAKIPSKKHAAFKNNQTNKEFQKHQSTIKVHIFFVALPQYTNHKIGTTKKFIHLNSFRCYYLHNIHHTHTYSTVLFTE